MTLHMDSTLLCRSQGGVGAYACDGEHAGWRQAGDLASCVGSRTYRGLHGS